VELECCFRLRDGSGGCCTYNLSYLLIVLEFALQSHFASFAGCFKAG
jgi:hypothetical protein